MLARYILAYPKLASRARGLAPDFLLLILAVALFLLLTLPNLELPGINYDDAADVVLTMQLMQGREPYTPYTVTLLGRKFPLMVAAYTGVVSTYLALPFFWLGGITLASFRAMNLSVGLSTLVLLYLVCKKLYNRWVGGLALFLLASDPSLIFWGRSGNRIALPMLPLALGSVLCLLHWRHSRKGIHLYAGFFLLGLGMACKINFLWFLVALACAFLALEILPRLVERRVRGTLDYRKTWMPLPTVALALLSFGIGALPLIRANLPGWGTLRFIRANLSHTQLYGVSNIQYLGNLWTRLRQFQKLLEGATFTPAGGTFSNPATPILVASAIVGSLLSLFSRPGRARWRATSLPLLLLAAMFVQSPFTVSSLSPVQLILTLPFAYMVAGAALGHPWAQRLPLEKGRRLALAGRALALITLLIVLALNLRVAARYHSLLKRTGGVDYDSDAIYGLAAYLEKEGLAKTIALDWGIARSVQFLTQGRVECVEAITYLGQPGQELLEFYRFTLPDPAVRYLLHPESLAAFPKHKALLERAAAESHKELIVEMAFPQRDGRVVYEVYRAQELPKLFEPPPIEHPLSVNLGGQVLLLGYRMDSAVHQPGSTLRFALYWKALTPMKTSYHVFAHLLDAEGHLSAQKDNPPVHGSYPTTAWAPAEIIVDDYAIPIPPGAPPGAYRLFVGMYELKTLQRLPIVDGGQGDAVHIATIQVGG